MIEIEDISVVEIDSERVEVSARCLEHVLYFRLPQSRLCHQAIGDALVLAVLAPAMRAGSTIRLPEPYQVSSRLVSQLDAIQDIWRSWNPSLKKVALEAGRYEPKPPADGIGLFHAGGVDSSYSLIKHRDDVQILISAFGYDFNLSDEDMHRIQRKNRNFAEQLGKEFIQFETNFARFVFESGVSRTFVFGAGLACMGMLTGLKRCFIASSHSAANLKPEGSHPVLDHHFSNGITEFVHDEIVGRLHKTLTIARHPEFLGNLHVCWDQAGENCGVCSKCVRTMMGLRLAGVEGPFPGVLTPKLLQDMASCTEYEYVVELVVAAHAAGDRQSVRSMKKGLRRHDLREAVRYVDMALFGGRIQAWRRHRSPEPDDLVLVDLRPDVALD